MGLIFQQLSLAILGKSLIFAGKNSVYVEKKQKKKSNIINRHSFNHL